MSFATPQIPSSTSPSSTGSRTCEVTAVPARRAACLDRPELFQHPLLEDPPRSSAPSADRRTSAGLERQAAEVCRTCPLLVSCLYEAVVRHDVAGYAGGTTARERMQIRATLGITVEPENLDTLAGVVGGSRPVDHEEVVRLRAANPDESLERLAQRLGCSLSTVKRHLRRERHSAGAPRPARAEPHPGAVIAATRIVLDRQRSRVTTAA